MGEMCAVRASEDEPPASDDDGLLASFNKALLKYVPPTEVAPSLLGADARRTSSRARWWCSYIPHQLPAALWHAMGRNVSAETSASLSLREDKGTQQHRSLSSFDLNRANRPQPTLQFPPTPSSRRRERRVRARRRRGVEEFGKLLEQDDDDDLDVLRCALWIAQHRNADLDVELCIRQMDELVRVQPPDFPTPCLLLSALAVRVGRARERASEPTRTLIG